MGGKVGQGRHRAAKRERQRDFRHYKARLGGAGLKLGGVPKPPAVERLLKNAGSGEEGTRNNPADLEQVQV